MWWDETREVRRDSPPDLDEVEETLEEKSGIEGRDRRGGTKTVDREPLLDVLLLLSIERIVRIDPVIDPVGERVIEEESGIAMGRLTASL